MRAGQVRFKVGALAQAGVLEVEAAIEQHAGRACGEQGLQIDWMIHHDVLYEHYRNLGMEAFLDASLTPWAKEGAEAHFARRLAAVPYTDRCASCAH